MKFNIVTDSISNDMFNFYYKDYNELIKKLEQYVYKMINLYNLNEYEIKKVLILLWSNITSSEMLNIEDYIDKYISFIDNDILLNKSGSKYISNLGILNYSFDIQSYMQETPYCFNAYIKSNNDYYYLPRISYGIIGDKCYIYAIQNKQKNDKNDYNNLVRKRLNKLNSGINKYRNVEPSSLLSLILFISILKKYNINRFEVVTNLPIRRQSRKLVNDYKLQFKSQYQDYKELKKQIEDTEERIIYNTTIRFQNSFKKLLYYFKIIMELPSNDNLLLEVLSMNTNNELINEIIESEENYGKSL